MKRFLTSVLVACLAAIALISVPTAASANGGSDSATPYTVATDGLYLPDGDVFTDASHVNIKTNKGEFNIHFEAKFADPNHAEWRNRPFDHKDPRNQFYGQSFLPWEAFKGFEAKSEFCVTWVQVKTNKGYNQHFGEGGQEPVGPGCVNPTPKTEYGTWSKVNFTCDMVVGQEIPITRTNTVITFWWDGKEKSRTQVTETGKYVVTDTDLIYPNTNGIDCRTDKAVVLPTLKKASVTCVAEKNVYTPAVVTLPASEYGVWEPVGPVTLERDVPSTVTFKLNEGALYKLGNLPSNEGTFWAGTVAENRMSVAFNVQSNHVDDLADCDLANSGMDTTAVKIAAGVGLVALIGGGILMAVRRRKTAEVE